MNSFSVVPSGMRAFVVALVLCVVAAVAGIALGGLASADPADAAANGASNEVAPLVVSSCSHFAAAIGLAKLQAEQLAIMREADNQVADNASRNSVDDRHSHDARVIFAVTAASRAKEAARLRGLEEIDEQIQAEIYAGASDCGMPSP